MEKILQFIIKSFQKVNDFMGHSQSQLLEQEMGFDRELLSLWLRAKIVSWLPAKWQPAAILFLMDIGIQNNTTKRWVFQ